MIDEILRLVPPPAPPTIAMELLELKPITFDEIALELGPQVADGVKLREAMKNRNSLILEPSLEERQKMYRAQRDACWRKCSSLHQKRCGRLNESAVTQSPRNIPRRSLRSLPHAAGHGVYNHHWEDNEQRR